MGCQFRIDPTDHSNIHISDLKEVVVLWLLGTSSAAVNQPRHKRVFYCRSTDRLMGWQMGVAVG